MKKYVVVGLAISSIVFSNVSFANASVEKRKSNKKHCVRKIECIQKVDYYQPKIKKQPHHDGGIYR